MFFIPAHYRISAWLMHCFIYLYYIIALQASIEQDARVIRRAFVINFMDISETDLVSRIQKREREKEIFLFPASFFRRPRFREGRDDTCCCREDYDDERRKERGYFISIHLVKRNGLSAIRSTWNTKYRQTHPYKG